MNKSLAVLWLLLVGIPLSATAQEREEAAPAEAAQTVQTEPDAAEPLIVSPPASPPAAAGTDAAAADMPEDEITSGEAFVRTLIQGGWTMVFLLIVSIFGVAYTVERFVHLRRKYIAPEGLAEEASELFKRHDHDALQKRVAGDGSTLGRMIASILKHRRQGPAAVSTMAGDTAARDLKRHLQRAYPLAVVATLSPLLGLLGTVIGMIGAFGKVAAAGSLGDASILGGDISKALVTTGAGLGIAVPALALYHYFKARTSLFAIELEEQASELITDWFSLDEQPTGDAAKPTSPKAATTTPAPDRTERPDTPRPTPQPKKEPAHAD